MTPFLHNPRRGPRVPLRLRVDIAHRGDSWEAETEDLGPGGCLVLSQRPLVERAPLRLVLRASELPDTLSVSGSVAWATPARGGVAFRARQLGLGVDPEAWFKRLVAAQPRLMAALGRVPERVALDAALFLMPAPRRIVDFEPDELLLLRHADNGVRVQHLLSRAGLAEERGRRALFALFEKKVLTLTLGEAGAETWRWRALVAASGLPPPPVVEPGGPPPASSAQPAPQAPPAPAGPRPFAPPRMERVAPPSSLLRGVNPSRRSPQAQARLDDARAAAAVGRIHDAVGLLRAALALAPRDPEIASLLGELAFKDRKM
jgi:PilZ domain